MMLFIIGAILWLVSFTLKSNVNSPFAKFSNILKMASFVVIAIGILSSAFRQIDAGKGEK